MLTCAEATARSLAHPKLAGHIDQTCPRRTTASKLGHLPYNQSFPGPGLARSGELGPFLRPVGAKTDEDSSLGDQHLRYSGAVDSNTRGIAEGIFGEQTPRVLRDRHLRSMSPSLSAISISGVFRTSASKIGNPGRDIRSCHPCP